MPNTNGITPGDKGYLKNRAKLTEEASKDLATYLELKSKIGQIDATIANSIEQQRKATEENVVISKKLLDIKNKVVTATIGEVTELQGQLDANEKLIEHADTYLVDLQKQKALHKDAIKDVSKFGVAWRSAGKTLKTIGSQLLSNNGWLTEQQKAVKETEMTMGVLSDQANGFRMNTYKTSLSTAKIGMDTKQLAIIQGTYSQTLGRSVKLNEEQLTAVAELAAGTTLGAEGAAEFAGNMDNFGISAKDSAKYVEDVLNDSHKMGLNASKVLKTIGSNIKMMNRYNFKGGVKGLAKMAALTTKFKLEMESVAGFADKVMDPEGAVEMAASLQVLGGAWSKLGDPFELMFRSRNDMAGLTQDIIEAANGTAKWNEATGEFNIDPMELHRLREVANVTGMSAEQLAEMAKESAKFSKIKTQIGGNFSDEDKEYIASLSQFNKSTNGFEFTFFNEDGQSVTRNVKDMSDITSSQLAKMKDEKASLKKRAEQALTFDETLTNLLNTFKSTLLPGFEILTKSLQDSVGGFTDWAKENNFFEGLANFGKVLGTIGASIVEFVTKNPIITALGLVIGKTAIWLMRGRLLGMGFNSTAMGKGGIGGGAGNVAGKVASKGGGVGFGSKLGGKLYGKGLGSGGAIGGGVLAAGISGYDEWTENSDKGMKSGENAMRTGLRGGGAGLGAWGGAAAGAAIGSAVPVIGTLIGGLVGAGIGAWAGGAAGNAAGNALGNEEFNDFVSRPGSNPVSFSSKDTLIGAKTGGPIDKMLNTSTTKDGGVNGGSGKLEVNFSKPLKIDGTITLISDGKTAKIDMNDPILMRNLSRVLQEELSKSINGGAISSNPS